MDRIDMGVDTEYVPTCPEEPSPGIMPTVGVWCLAVAIIAGVDGLTVLAWWLGRMVLGVLLRILKG